PAVQLLGVAALSAALQGHEVGFPPQHAADVPRPLWRPTSMQQVAAYKREALQLLKVPLGSPHPEVRVAAVRAFLAHARALAELGLAAEVVALFEELVALPDVPRREAWETIGDLREYLTSLSDDQRGRLDDVAQRIYGESIGDRLRRYAAGWSRVAWRRSQEPGGKRQEQVVADLADEAFDQLGEVRPHLAWL